MYWALTTDLVDTRGFRFEQVLADIQTLNHWARAQPCIDATRRRQRRGASRAGLEVRAKARVDLEVARGYRLHEVHYVGAGHESSNSLSRFFAR